MCGAGRLGARSRTRRLEADVAAYRSWASTDICSRQVRADLFDHLVGASEQGWGYDNAKRACCLQVYFQLNPRGLLNRKVRRLCALENAIDIARSAPPHVEEVDC